MGCLERGSYGPEGSFREAERTVVLPPSKKAFVDRQNLTHAHRRSLRIVVSILANDGARPSRPKGWMIPSPQADERKASSW